jgi:hypothetical protein
MRLMEKRRLETSDDPLTTDDPLRAMRMAARQDADLELANGPLHTKKESINGLLAVR